MQPFIKWEGDLETWTEYVENIIDQTNDQGKHTNLSYGDSNGGQVINFTILFDEVLYVEAGIVKTHRKDVMWCLMSK